MHGTPARTPGADRHSVCVCAIYGVLVVCFAVHYVYYYYVQKHTKNQTTLGLYNGVQVLSVRPPRVPCPWPSVRVVWGRKIASVSEFLVRAVVKCHLSEAGRSPPACPVVRAMSVCGPAGTRSRVWSSRRSGGRAIVVSRRVILLRCHRIRGPTGPANLCTGGQLPSNDGMCIRSQGDAAGGHVARTQC